MIDSGGDPCLADEAVAEDRVLGERRGDELERDRAVQVQLGGPVDDAHAAATGDCVDAMAGERLAALKL